MVAAISAADRNFSVVIHFLHRASSVCLLCGNGEAIRPIKGTHSNVASTPLEVGVWHDHESGSLVRHLYLTRAASGAIGSGGPLRVKSDGSAISALHPLYP
jgi:hypothetical protein